MAVVTAWGRHVEAAVGIVICRPLAAKLVGRVEPGAEGLMEAAIGAGPKETSALPLCPCGRGWTILAEAVEAGIGAEQGLDALGYGGIKVGARGDSNIGEGENLKMQPAIMNETNLLGGEVRCGEDGVHEIAVVEAL
jgi:hypothetical protein